MSKEEAFRAYVNEQRLEAASQAQNQQEHILSLMEMVREEPAQSNDTEEQLRQVIGELGIEMEDIRPFSRCLICNVANEDIEKDRIHGQVPDYVWENNTVFQSCPECKKIYWPGSHIERSLERIEALFT